jgi:flagellum-specific peptidoglycan hydrolase FlgJ
LDKMTPQQQTDFIAGLVPGAQAAQAQFGVFASVSIAQGIFESSWGQSDLTKIANNYYGIKDSAGWTGDTVTMPTGEDRPDGSSYTIQAAFRKYPDQAASILDHAMFLSNNGNPERYAAALQCTDGPSQAMAIAAAGYSTNPKYGQMLCQEIHARNLTQYDLLEAV